MKCLNSNHEQLRMRLIQFNSHFQRRYVHSYASGIGLCADLVGVLKTAVRCWNSGYQLVLGIPAPTRRSQNTRWGWQDIFEPTFSTAHSRLFRLLNRGTLPGQSYVPHVRQFAGGVLRLLTDGDLFMPENEQLGDMPDRICFPELDLDEEYWVGMGKVSRAMFHPRPEVILQKEMCHQTLGLASPYIGVHIRRGDKIAEANYTRIDSYIQAIRSCGVPFEKIFVASDDVTAAAALQDALKRFEVVTLTRNTDRGYQQAEFNALPDWAKRDEMVRFVAELWLLAEASEFVGSSTSNIFYFLRYLRGNMGVHDADFESSHAPEQRARNPSY